MGQRRRARELALQMLFQIDLTGSTPEEVFPLFWSGRDVPRELRGFAERLVTRVAARRDTLDAVIAACAEHWRLERMAVVDRNVLRLATSEMLDDPDTPKAVVIDEAIEVARKFGGEDSARFANGVLDAVRLRIERGEVGVGPAGEAPSEQGRG